MVVTATSDSNPAAAEVDVMSMMVGLVCVKVDFGLCKSSKGEEPGRSRIFLPAADLADPEAEVGV